MFASRGRPPTPAEVFVPSGLPLDDLNVYATRAGPEADLRRYMERAQVPVVFGEYGVGKTTLVRRFLLEAEKENRLVYIPSAAGKALTGIAQIVLEHLKYEVEVERTEGQLYAANAGIKAYVVNVGGEARAEDGKTLQLAVSSPTDAKLLDLMAERELVLVVDEMHKASTEFRQDLADFLKSIKGGRSRFPLVVLIGTTLDAENLVAQDPGIDRFVKELMVEPLSDGEATFIVEEGFRALGIEIDVELVETIVRTAAGAPTIVQEVCLNMAEAIVSAEVEVANGDFYADAIRTYLWDHGRRLASIYVKSIEQTGSKRYRKQILLAMAQIPHDYVNMEEIASQVSIQLGDATPSTALSGPLRSLKTGGEGILQDVERQTGNRVYNLNAFRDPMMKSFIRFMDELEKQGVLAADTMRTLGEG